MTPIEYRVDTAFLQALRCVEYRIPVDDRLQHSAFTLALGVRYGLVGAAATHQLLINADEFEIAAIRTAASDWDHLVSGHLRHHLLKKIKGPHNVLDAERVGKIAGEILRDYFASYPKHPALNLCLEATGKSFADKHHSEIGRGWAWFRMRKARSIFAVATAESVRFAILFFERRKVDLEEVAEIALLGE
jgi:hypothetical protein